MLVAGLYTRTSGRPREIFGEGFSPNISAYPFQCHSPIAFFLRERKTVDAWKTSNKQFTFGNREGEHWTEIKFNFFRISIFHRARKWQGVCNSFVSLVNDAMPYYRAKISETFILLYTLYTIRISIKGFGDSRWRSG